jgi:hypothetical protein
VNSFQPETMISSPAKVNTHRRIDTLSNIAAWLAPPACLAVRLRHHRVPFRYVKMPFLRLYVCVLMLRLQSGLLKSTHVWRLGCALQVRWFGAADGILGAVPLTSSGLCRLGGHLRSLLFSAPNASALRRCHIVCASLTSS